MNHLKSKKSRWSIWEFVDHIGIWEKFNNRRCIISTNIKASKRTLFGPLLCHRWASAERHKIQRRVMGTLAGTHLPKQGKRDTMHHCHAWFLPAGSINRTTNKTARTCMQRTRAHMYYVCTYPPNDKDLNTGKLLQIRPTQPTRSPAFVCGISCEVAYVTYVVARMRPAEPYLPSHATPRPWHMRRRCFACMFVGAGARRVRTSPASM